MVLLAGPSDVLKSEVVLVGFDEILTIGEKKIGVLGIHLGDFLQ